MPYDTLNIGPGKPVLGRHIADLYTSLTGGMADQPISVSNLSVSGTLTVNGVPMVICRRSGMPWLPGLPRSRPRRWVDTELRTYVDGIMSVLDPAGPP